MPAFIRYSVWIAAALSPPVHAADDCPVARILEPAHAIIADSRPTFEWAPLPGVDLYRVRLQSRVPEGELLAGIDTLVAGNRFTPPRPLTTKRAVVKVLVTAPCESPPPLDSGLRLLVDTGLTCPATGFAYDPATGTWQWRAVQGASGYVLVRYAMPHGEVIERRELAVPAAVRIGGTDIIAVRARCANGYSDWAFAP